MQQHVSQAEMIILRVGVEIKYSLNKDTIPTQTGLLSLVEKLLPTIYHLLVRESLLIIKINY